MKAISLKTGWGKQLEGTQYTAQEFTNSLPQSDKEYFVWVNPAYGQIVFLSGQNHHRFSLSDIIEIEEYQECDIKYNSYYFRVHLLSGPPVEIEILCKMEK